ncbi:hypothetical protein NDU88_001961 [Pleurodeles waltl]|uniref:Uncharacterized protein n=1 Tax=Pleurodeles waltl TaxID=8319 RepID=A0AAV7TLN9_PLEWA|nr:hypothetical protein NDU88_001961 [Pleurodeles waltl]
MGECAGTWCYGTETLSVAEDNEAQTTHQEVRAGEQQHPPGSRRRRSVARMAVSEKDKVALGSRRGCHRLAQGGPTRKRKGEVRHFASLDTWSGIEEAYDNSNEELTSPEACMVEDTDRDITRQMAGNCEPCA